jgi:hypothetical protein
MKLLLVAVICVVLAFVRGEEPAPKASKPVRSLFQACRDDIRRLCLNRRGVLNCLEKNSTEVQNDTCGSWLKARAACKSDVEKSTCATQPFRACLMKLEQDKISPACSGSDFYNSVKRTRNLINKRRNQSSGTSTESA